LPTRQRSQTPRRYLAADLPLVYPQAAGPILRDGRLIGYVGIGCEGEVDHAALESANDLLCGALALCLGGYADGAQIDLEQLLVKERLTEGESRRLETAFPPPYVFAVLTSDDPRVSTLQYVRGLLCGKERHTAGCLQGERYLHLLMYGVHRADAMRNIEAALAGMDMKYALSGGVSDFFDCAAELPAHRMQAMLAMTVGAGSGQSGAISFFRERYGEILCYGALENLGRDVCALPAVERLAEEDRREGSEYLKTLETYLGVFQDRTAAAARLGVHKNTVHYRLQRIEELTGLAPEDADSADRLELGLMMHAVQTRLRGDGQEAEHGR
jgi:hypothetical protein